MFAWLKVAGIQPVVLWQSLHSAVVGRCVVPCWRWPVLYKPDAGSTRDVQTWNSYMQWPEWPRSCHDTT